MASPINRVTMFKVPDPDNQKKLVKAYEALARDQSKVGNGGGPPLPLPSTPRNSSSTDCGLGFQDGKPYITYLSAGVAETNPRSLGYTVVAKSEFASPEDMRYYDDECPAHATLKKTAALLGMAEKPLTVYFAGHPQYTAAAH